MDPILLMMTVGVAGTLAALLLARQAETGRRLARERAAAEHRRVRECGEVALFYANHVGHMARQAMNRDELESLIDGGIRPHELSEMLAERTAKLAGPLLGFERLGETTIAVSQPEELRPRGLYVVGRAGSGKTTLICHLIRQDLEAGHGLGVIAREHELLTEEILPHIPKARWDDVIYVDPADPTCPPFNPLSLERGEDIDLRAAETLAIFQRLFDEESGGGAPRMDAINRQWVYTLMQIPAATLLDVERLLDRQDDSFRRQVVRQIVDEDAIRFWTNTYPAYPRDAHLAVLNRLGRLLRPKVMRNFLCAPEGNLSIRRIMDEGKVLLVSASDGVLGEQNAALVGQLITAKVQIAAMSRANAPKRERRLFPLYLDEFQSLCATGNTSFETILSRGRKYGLALVLAHQQMGQLGEGLMREILGNVSTVVAFNVGATDARRLSRELIGEFDGVPEPIDPATLLSLRIGEAVTRIGRNVQKITTPPPPAGGSEAVRDEVVRRSRARYGRQIAPSKSAPMNPPAIEGIDPGEVFGA